MAEEKRRGRHFLGAQLARHLDFMGWEMLGSSVSKLDGHENGIGMEAMKTWCIKLDHKAAGRKKLEIEELERQKARESGVGHISQGIRAFFYLRMMEKHGKQHQNWMVDHLPY